MGSAALPDGLLDWAVAAAVKAAQRSGCAKSKRGAVVFGAPRDPMHRGSLYSTGCNAPALGRCSGSEACRRDCPKICVHAEAEAVRGFVRVRWGPDQEPVYLVHAKLGPDGELAAGGGPSCWQCSKEILAAGVAGVWLFEKMGELWCPQVDSHVHDCLLCQGVSCVRHGELSSCDCDVLDRHGELPTVLARWRYYTAEAFHRRTLEACGLGVHDAAP